jgi:hypothetical protein
MKNPLGSGRRARRDRVRRLWRRRVTGRGTRPPTISGTVTFTIKYVNVPVTHRLGRLERTGRRVRLTAPCRPLSRHVSPKRSTQVDDLPPI